LCLGREKKIDAAFVIAADAPLRVANLTPVLGDRERGDACAAAKVFGDHLVSRQRLTIPPFDQPRIGEASARTGTDLTQVAKRSAETRADTDEGAVG
jgi:hypothetical protein